MIVAGSSSSTLSPTHGSWNKTSSYFCLTLKIGFLEWSRIVSFASSSVKESKEALLVFPLKSIPNMEKGLFVNLSEC